MPLSVDTQSPRAIQQEPHNCRELTACVIAVVSAAAAIFGFLLNSEALIVYAVVGSAVALALYLCSRSDAHSPLSSPDGRVTPQFTYESARTTPSSEPRLRGKPHPHKPHAETTLILHPSPLRPPTLPNFPPPPLFSLEPSVNSLPPLGPLPKAGTAFRQLNRSLSPQPHSFGKTLSKDWAPVTGIPVMTRRVSWPPSGTVATPAVPGQEPSFFVQLKPMSGPGVGGKPFSDLPPLHSQPKTGPRVGVGAFQTIQE